MNKALLVLVLVVVLGGGYMMMNSQKTVAPVENAMTALDSTGVEKMATDEIASAAREFTVDGFEFGYDQKTLTVKKGDTVKITLTNSGKMPHDWVVDEFNAKTKIVKNGETDSITFVADTAGTFEYYCSVGSHRKMGMVGKLVVE